MPVLTPSNNSNSTYTVQNLVDDAQSFSELAPVLPVGGWSDAPALSIANDVMSAMLLGGPNGQPFNWKWNRVQIAPFTTISYQLDYFIPGLTNLSWIESAWAVDINNASIPKPKIYLEGRKDLLISDLPGNPGKIAWQPNDQALTGTWGAAPLGPTAVNPSGQTNNAGTNLSGCQNPGPNVIYTNPIGAATQPINATTCITDPNGNLWTVTTFGTCGSVQPTWPVAPNPGDTVTDGTVVWTNINPKGQGFRLNPIPPQAGVAWVIQVVGQKVVPKITTLGQTLDPVPDDYYTYFKQGFFAQCFRRHPDPKVRARFNEEWALWNQSLIKAFAQGNREEDDYGFFPSDSIMQSGYAWQPINPSQPYGPFIR